jgi:predicted secreted protein
LQLTEADNGRSITMTVGETGVLTLPENPGTGYRWQFRPVPGLELTDDTDRPTDAPGAQRARRLWCTASTVGEWVLDGRLAREWEPAPIRRFRVTVWVVDPSARSSE